MFKRKRIKKKQTSLTVSASSVIVNSPETHDPELTVRNLNFIVGMIPNGHELQDLYINNLGSLY